MEFYSSLMIILKIVILRICFGMRGCVFGLKILRREELAFHNAVLMIYEN